jgi:hypothetical protein
VWVEAREAGSCRQALPRPLDWVSVVATETLAPPSVTALLRLWLLFRWLPWRIWWFLPFYRPCLLPWSWNWRGPISESEEDLRGWQMPVVLLPPWVAAVVLVVAGPVVGPAVAAAAFDDALAAADAHVVVFPFLVVSSIQLVVGLHWHYCCHRAGEPRRLLLLVVVAELVAFSFVSKSVANTIRLVSSNPLQRLVGDVLSYYSRDGFVSRFLSLFALRAFFYDLFGFAMQIRIFGLQILHQDASELDLFVVAFPFLVPTRAGVVSAAVVLPLVGIFGPGPRRPWLLVPELEFDARVSVQRDHDLSHKIELRATSCNSWVRHVNE